METAKKKFAWLSALSYAGLTLLVLATVIPLLPPGVFKWLRKVQHTPPIKQVLANAWNVWVSAPDEKGVYYHFVDLGPSYSENTPALSSDLFWSLKRTSRFNVAPPRTKPDIHLVIRYNRTGLLKWLESGRTFYQYVSTTGELGRGDEWCVVPDDFRQRIRHLYLTRPGLPIPVEPGGKADAAKVRP